MSIQRRSGWNTYKFGCIAALVDNLSYTYTSGGNRLQKVNDTAYSTYRDKGFKPGSTANFQYDANGNATYDPNKQVTISYNHLNLPHHFDFGSGKVIDIIYDATGKKLRKIVKQGSTTLYTQDYVNGIEYKDSKIESFPQSHGRLYNINVNTSSNNLNLRYEYNINDHLGNTRVVYTDKDNDGRIDFGTSTTSNEILDESHYYPFGMQMDGPWVDDFGSENENKYLYNGKELNTDFGLDWADYGTRWYDPSIARFHSVDIATEGYASRSTYLYAENNPIKFIDYMGMFGDYFDQNGNHLGSDGIDDGKKHVVRDKKEVKELKSKAKSAKKSKSTFTVDGSSLNSTVILPSDAVLNESLDVLDRTVENGGLREEASLVMKDGTVVRGETGPDPTYSDGTSTAETSVPDLPDGTSDSDVAAMIHSHPTTIAKEGSKIYPHSATIPTTNDGSNFERFERNVIVGPLGQGGMTRDPGTGANTIKQKPLGIVIYGKGSILNLTRSAATKIAKH